MAVRSLHRPHLQVSSWKPNHKGSGRAVKSNGNPNTKQTKKDVLQELLKTLHLQETFSETAGRLLAMLTWRIGESSQEKKKLESGHLSKTTISQLLELTGERRPQNISELRWGLPVDTHAMLITGWAHLRPPPLCRVLVSQVMAVCLSPPCLPAVACCGKYSYSKKNF